MYFVPDSLPLIGELGDERVEVPGPGEVQAVQVDKETVLSVGRMT
jgi:hypothetical protein